MTISNRIIPGLILTVTLLVSLPVAYACAEHGTQAATLEPAAGEEAQPENHASGDGHDHSDTSTQSSSTPADADHHEAITLKRVEPKLICMMNNKFMVSEQIAVEVDGKTYYGCCPMCKERLKNEAAARQAIDPISGNTVDKAAAVIGAAPNGAVYYFENEENLQEFSSDPPRYIQPTDVEP